MSQFKFVQIGPGGGKLIWDNVLKSASVFLLHPYHGVIVIVIVFDKPKSKSLVQAQPQKKKDKAKGPGLGASH